MINLLERVIDHLVIKRSFAASLLEILYSRRESGKNSKWTVQQLSMVTSAREKFMPKRLRAYGETRLSNMENIRTSSSSVIFDEISARAIPSEALGSTTSTKEPLETRTTSSACSNWSHECPASDTDEDIVQNSRKLESWDKEPSEDIATN
jgi:hypothetical protein